MKRIFLAIVLATAFSVSATEESVYEPIYESASAKYTIYGQDLSEPARPTKKDSKIAFSLTGRVAKEMFEAMPPDRDIKCSDDAGFRFRSRDHEKLVCTYYLGEYACSFGFDLGTGKSIGGGSC